MAMVETVVPARLDRLPWARFHWLVVTGLGIAWVLDGLEVTLVGSLSGAIAQSPVLQMSAADVGASASAYLAGAVVGALGFGWLADRLGRKRLFAVTVLVYLTATLAAGLAWSFTSFALFRALTGAGIGGEYAAVNAAIQELIPARRRGFTDLVVNGSFWIGAAIGAGGSLIALDPRLIRQSSAGGSPSGSAGSLGSASAGGHCAAARIASGKFVTLMPAEGWAKRHQPKMRTEQEQRAKRRPIELEVRETARCCPGPGGERRA